jgi:alpha,alpha-trehalose phosphorylase
MTVPYDDRLGVHPQAAGFTRHARWDFDATPEDHYPLLLHYPYFDLYRKQVVKQADLVLAIYLCPDAFTPEQTARDFAYYERLTVRDSSLSACCQAIVAAEVGHLGLAYDYLGEAALIDLGDLERNTADGLHLAALAGAWTALVAGFGGMRRRDGDLTFAPHLPDGIDRLAFRLMERDQGLRVEIRPDATTYLLDDGEPMAFTHHGDRLDLTAGTPLTRPNPPTPPRSRPLQPPGREPASRARISPDM